MPKIALKTKKILVLMLAFAVLFTGCSIERKSAEVNATIDEPAAAPSATGSQPQTQIETPAPTIQDTENADLNVIETLDSSKSPFEKGYYDYQGNIGDNRTIQMSLYPQGNELVGTYLYENQQKEISLKGKAGEKEILLLEFDEAGKNLGTFQGKMAMVDQIIGTWVSSDKKTSYPFVLSLKSIIPGAEFGKRYATAVDSLSDQDVEIYASSIQSYIIDSHAEKLSEEINYPIKVKINRKETEILNKEDFIKNFDKIFYADFKHAIQNANTKYMFVNWQGIMFGTGTNNIWFNMVASADGDHKLMITAINN